MKAGTKLGVPVPNLRELRLAKNWSQVVLAEKSGVNKITVARAEKGGSIRKKNAVKLLHALGMNGDQPPEAAWGPMVTAAGASLTKELPAQHTEDDLVAAFRLLIEQLDHRIEAHVRRALAFAETKQAVTASSTPLRRESDFVPKPTEPEVVLPQDSAVAHGFPVTAMLNNWTIRYEKKFLKEYETSGLEGPARGALQKFAQLGEVYGGLGFKKLDRGMYRARGMQWSNASYGFRVNRRWRVLVRKDSGDKAYTITRLVHHDEIE